MDRDLEKFPLVSYVLHQSDPASHPAPSTAVQRSLFTRFPNIPDPEIARALILSLPNTTHQTLFIIKSLGPRPDRAAVSAARIRISQIHEAGVSAEEAAKEAEMYAAAVRLEELHEGYEKQIMSVEEDLARVYDSAVESTGGGVVNEEVVAVLKEAEAGGLERVDLSDRQLKFLPEDFGKIYGLVSLNLSGNELKFIPDAISGLQKLEGLDVSSNFLESLPDSIGLLINLRLLNVSGNKLTAIPESISQCRSLVELDASFNNLTFLPSNFGDGLLNLEKLSIQLNKIRFLPLSICEMQSLRYLDAHMNELHGLPIAIGKLTNLEVLNVSGNFSDLTEIPDAISDLINLRELDLSNNQIQALPDSFFRLEKLVKLNLEQNPLETPPLEVAIRGAEAVRGFMAKRWEDFIAAEQQRSIAEAKSQEAGAAGWFSWGTSIVSNLVFGVSQNGAGSKNPKESYLDQQL